MCAKNEYMASGCVECCYPYYKGGDLAIGSHSALLIGSNAEWSDWLTSDSQRCHNHECLWSVWQWQMCHRCSDYHRECLGHNHSTWVVTSNHGCLSHACHMAIISTWLSVGTHHRTWCCAPRHFVVFIISSLAPMINDEHSAKYDINPGMLPWIWAKETKNRE